MKKPGLIRNPRALRNRKEAEDVRDLAEDWLGARFAEPGSAEEISAALQDLAAQEVDWLIIDGGDGTVRDVLTVLPEIFGEKLPFLSIIPSGNSNVIAADVGSRRRKSALGELRAAARDGRGEINTRPCLEVYRDTGLPLLRGMFFGAGAFRRAVEIAHGSAYHERIGHGPSVALTAIITALQSVFGSKAESWSAGEPMTLTLDEAAPCGGDHFIILATTLNRLVLGIWPFWDVDRGPIRMLDVSARPERLGAGLWSLLRGRAPEWLRASSDYHSFGVGHIELDLTRDFVLDGEIYPSGPSGLRLETGPSIDYFRP